MNKPFFVASITISLIIGILIGYYFSPEYDMATANKPMMKMELGQADAFIDLRYIDGMISHHLSAIFILEQAQTQSTRPEIKTLAETVIAADKADIQKLYDTKKTWYNNTRKVTLFTKVNLGENNPTFDLRLLNALIQHHEEAIAKAQEIRTKSVRTETLDRADSTITALSSNKAQLESWRKEWYGI